MRISPFTPLFPLKIRVFHSSLHPNTIFMIVFVVYLVKILAEIFENSKFRLDLDQRAFKGSGLFPKTHLFRNLRDFFLHVQQIPGFPVQSPVLFLDVGKPLILLEHHPERRRTGIWMKVRTRRRRTDASHQLRSPHARSVSAHTTLRTSKQLLFTLFFPDSVFSLWPSLFPFPVDVWEPSSADLCDFFLCFTSAGIFFLLFLQTPDYW